MPKRKSQADDAAAAAGAGAGAAGNGSGSGSEKKVQTGAGVGVKARAQYQLRVRNAAQLVQVCDKRERMKAGKAMDQLATLHDAGLIVGWDGRIVAVGPEQELQKTYDSAGATYDTVLDATGRSVVPGLVDAHTHPVWAGDRVGEFKMKLAGKTYMEIHRAGGGIGFTVRHTRAASEDELLGSLMSRLQRMLRFGTTVLEGKSGYGLNTDAELKMLRVMHRAQHLQPITIVANYCGAHSIPKDDPEVKAKIDAATATAAAAAQAAAVAAKVASPTATAAQAAMAGSSSGSSSPKLKPAESPATVGVNAGIEYYTEQVITKQIPALKAAMERGEVSPRQIDVFCESGVFSVDQTRRILTAGQAIGLSVNFHGDELTPIRAAELAAELKATAVSHLEHISDAGIAALAGTGVVGVLLPTTAYVLRIEYPPARKMIERDMAVALGSDFNPNAHCLSLPHVMNLSAVAMRMTLNECLSAATINSAAALGVSADYGSLEVGKFGSFVLVAAPVWEHLVYQIADPPIERVVIKGVTAFHAEQPPTLKPAAAAAAAAATASPSDHSAHAANGSARPKAAAAAAAAAATNA